MARILPGVVLLVAVVAGFGFDAADKAPANLPAAASPRIKLLGASISEGEQSTVALKLEFINPGQTPLAFYGYPADSFDPPLAAGILWPFYQLEFMREGNWEAYFIGRCGTGAGTIEVPPQTSGTFDADFIAPNDWQAVRISINQSSTESEIDPDQVLTTWSRTFYREEVNALSK